MPEPIPLDPGLRDVASRYLTHLAGKPVPAHLEDDVIRYVVSRPRRGSVRGRLAAVGAVVVIAAVTAFAIAVHVAPANKTAGVVGNGAPPNTSPNASPPSVRITRTPGLFILPQIDRTITDAAVAARLATDIEQLPIASGDGPVMCAADFGTSYTLTFNLPGESAWTATVNVAGCRVAKLSNGPTRAATSISLFSDLGAALGLTNDELDPRPCPLPPGEHCYAQPTP